MPQIVNGLMKLGLHNQASPENRKLSLDLAGLVIYWEQRRLAESRGADQVSPLQPALNVIPALLVKHVA